MTTLPNLGLPNLAIMDLIVAAIILIALCFWLISFKSEAKLKKAIEKDSDATLFYRNLDAWYLRPALIRVERA